MPESGDTEWRLADSEQDAQVFERAAAWLSAPQPGEVRTVLYLGSS